MILRSEHQRSALLMSLYCIKCFFQIFRSNGLKASEILLTRIIVSPSSTSKRHEKGQMTVDVLEVRRRLCRSRTFSFSDGRPFAFKGVDGRDVVGEAFLNALSDDVACTACPKADRFARDPDVRPTCAKKNATYRTCASTSFEHPRTTGPCRSRGSEVLDRRRSPRAVTLAGRWTHPPKLDVGTASAPSGQVATQLVATRHAIG